MTDRVTRRIQEIEATIAEIVSRIKSTGFEALKTDLLYLSAMKVTLQHEAIWIGRVASSQIAQCSGAQDQRGSVREYRDVARMIPVPVAPYDGLDLCPLHAMLFQDLVDASLRTNSPSHLLDKID